MGIKKLRSWNMPSGIDRKDLLDPSKFADPVDVVSMQLDFDALLDDMFLIRAVEQKVASERERGAIGGPVHLGIGQEAVSVGIATQVRKDDAVYSAHRSHGHILALGTSIERFFCELLGLSNGLCGGRGGSMHLIDRSVGFYGSVPIMAGTVPLAAGAALAFKQKKNNSVAFAFLGDGAVEEGIVHETLNMASLMRLPIVFVVENNQFASHMHITQRQPEPFIGRFAVANNLDLYTVDGNDVGSVVAAASEAVSRAREDGVPSIVEAITYRWLGHVDWREDLDVGVNRSKSDLACWKKRDPISRLVDALVHEELLSEDDWNDRQTNILSWVEHCWEVAKTSRPPEADTLTDWVFSAR
jgi:TPP-dependent pyruvate/acetoin dehydrogenase alpha subunit